jgi:hypothetical protein
MLFLNWHIISLPFPVMLKARPGQNPSAYDFTRSYSREHINMTAAEFNLSKLLGKKNRNNFLLYSRRGTLTPVLVRNSVKAHMYVVWGDFVLRLFNADLNKYE